MSNIYEKKAREILEAAGIKINGSEPWDIKVFNENLYRRVFDKGSLGLGEAYMEGWWDCDALDELFFRLMRLNLAAYMKINLPTVLTALRARIFNMQTKGRSHKVAKEHYDLGNDFYEKMLDKYMLYTCAYWKDLPYSAKNLDQAQEYKLELICKKMQLKPGEKVLDLGCGWGGFARYAAEKYKCKVTAYNISGQQVNFAKDFCRGLPVEIIKADYREAKGTYDKVVSIGMTEHVGFKNYLTLMKTVDRSLKKGGLFLLHTIGNNTHVSSADPWFEKYIFPHSVLPSIQALAKASEGIFVMEDWHNFGADYDKTVKAWFENFDRNWPQFKDQYGEKFYRMWKYYLLSCAGSFRARFIQLWQIVYSKGGVIGGYESVR